MVRGLCSGIVKLVRTEHEAIKLINRAFGRGFSQFDRWAGFMERIRKVKEGAIIAASTIF